MSISDWQSWGAFPIFLIGLGALAVTPVLGQAQGLEQAAPAPESAPVPPPFSKDRLIAIDLPGAGALKFSFDPATIVVTSDRIVRYVAVATSATVSQGLFEGIRCGSGEFITYARTNSVGQWVAVKDLQWRLMSGNNTSKHSLALAHQGVCEGRSVAANDSAQLISRLKNQRGTVNP